MRHFIVLMLAAVSSTAAAKGLGEVPFDRIDRAFIDWARDSHMPGLVYGIVSDAQLIHVKGIGVQDLETRRPVTPDTLFRIASMSKAFTALAILKLRDEGRLGLDAPAETYVPQMRGWHYLTSDSPKITVRDLLNHDAGFVEDNPWGDRQLEDTEAELTSILKAGVAFANAPGVTMEYSNLGYAILGRIVGNVSKMPFQDFIGHELMAPLGMSHTGYDIFKHPLEARALGYRWENDHWTREPDTGDGSFGSAGGVETSANDYAKWVAFLLSAWPARDDADPGPVKRGTVRQVVEGQNFIGVRERDSSIGGNPCRGAMAYGMAWRVIDDCDLGRVLTHSGGLPGYGSVVVLLPDAGVGIFVFSNVTYASDYAPAFRALLTLKEANAIPKRKLEVTPGLSAAYAAAISVWRAGRIDGAPLAKNVLMDRDAAHWQTELAALKAAVGECEVDPLLVADSAMEGHFTWTCPHGTIEGRVQRAPTPDLEIQSMEFKVRAPRAH